MIGSDVCGFNAVATDTLCARWAMLGAFAPFYRNHADISAPPQEFYRWPIVTEAAKIAIDARFRLLDYIYTAFNRQSRDGTPLANPLWFKYPTDSNTFAIDLQYLYGDSVLVSPVTDANVTSVSIYLPEDIFYDFWTYKPVQGEGKYITLNDVNYTSIPVHYRGGTVVPQRISGANTTTELRKKDFILVVAPSKDQKASGSLYLDDGESLSPQQQSEITFSYNSSTIGWNGSFGYDPGVNVASLVLLGQTGNVNVKGGNNGSYDEGSMAVTIEGPWKLTSSQTLTLEGTT
jgi:alpha-glucosidase